MEITINYYGQAVSVSVEVYEYLTQADHKAENLAHEQRRHWDGRKFDEYMIDRNGHSLSIVVDGDFHRPFLRSDFWGLNEGGGERQRGWYPWPGNRKAPEQYKTVRARDITV